MVNLPTDSQRVSIMGRTGSGKTVAGAWHLSLRDFDAMPWVIMNFKRDQLLDSIPHIQEIDYNDKLPKERGLYQIHADPDDYAGAEKFFMNAWRQGHIGIFCDEGYCLDRNSRGFKLIQVQGRSLKIPTITCTQRPVQMSRFIISEADYLQVFGLTHDDDIDTVKGFIPRPVKRGPHILDQDLPPYHSVYHDIAKGKKGSVILSPVPGEQDLLDTFDQKLKKYKKLRAI